MIRSENEIIRELEVRISQLEKSNNKSASTLKRAKVSYRQGDDSVHFYVLQAIGRGSLKASEVMSETTLFTNRIHSVGQTLSGIFLNFECDAENVFIESTRAGIALSCRFVATMFPGETLNLKLLKAAFKAEGIAF